MISNTSNSNTIRHNRSVNQYSQSQRRAPWLKRQLCSPQSERPLLFCARRQAEDAAPSVGQTSAERPFVSWRSCSSLLRTQIQKKYWKKNPINRYTAEWKTKITVWSRNRRSLWLSNKISTQLLYISSCGLRHSKQSDLEWFISCWLCQLSLWFLVVDCCLLWFTIATRQTHCSFVMLWRSIKGHLQLYRMRCISSMYPATAPRAKDWQQNELDTRLWISSNQIRFTKSGDHRVIHQLST